MSAVGGLHGGDSSKAGSWKIYSDSVLLGRRAMKVIGTPRPSLGILSSPMLQEREITTCHPPLILQVLVS